jgi:hypothetical protein
LPAEKRLPDARITMDVEQEPAALIIERELEIIPVLAHLTLTANKTALLALSDALLKRPPLPSHLSPKYRCSQPNHHKNRAPHISSTWRGSPSWKI